jgi:hypothetical protein
VKKSELRQIIKEEIQGMEDIKYLQKNMLAALTESKGKAVRVASYSKAKELKDFQKIMAKNPKNPPIDMTLWTRPQGPYGTPEEYRDHFGWTQLTVLGPRENYRVVILYENGKWVQGQ